MQTQVRFNRVPEKVPEKAFRKLRCEPGQLLRFNRVPEKVPEKVWEALVVPEKVAEKVPEKVLVMFDVSSAWLRSKLQKDLKK